MTRVFVALSVAALVACDWNPPLPHLDGTWRFRFDDLTDGKDVQCRIVAMDVVITQEGSSFTGVQSGEAERQCITEFGEPMVAKFADDTLFGAIGHQSISFVFVRTPGSTVNWSANAHAGAVSGNVMLGRATWAGRSESRNINGTFAAFRLPE